MLLDPSPVKVAVAAWACRRRLVLQTSLLLAMCRAAKAAWAAPAQQMVVRQALQLLEVMVLSWPMVLLLRTMERSPVARVVQAERVVPVLTAHKEPLDQLLRLPLRERTARMARTEPTELPLVLLP